MSRYITLLGLFFMGSSILLTALKIGPQAEAPIIFILGTIVYLGGKMNKKTQSE
jgi:hypothetical protein